MSDEHCHSSFQHDSVTDHIARTSGDTFDGSVWGQFLPVVCGQDTSITSAVRLLFVGTLKANR